MIQVANGILDAARRYAAQKFAVIPCVGKRPIVDDWQNATVPDEAIIRTWQGLNIGIVTGERSNNLIVIDFDGKSGYHKFIQVFPQFADTFTVATGSGKGYHLYLQVDILPHTTKAMKIAKLDNANIELKANGQQVIAAPSIHPDTKQPYTVFVNSPVLKLEHVQAIVEWIEAFKPDYERRKNHAYQQYDGVEPPNDVTTAIFATLGVTGSRINKSGFTAHAIHCPFHDDDEPSAGVKMVTDARSKAGGITCPACGRFYNWKEVAGQLNIPVPEVKHPKVAPRPHNTSIVANGLWFDGTLPDNWRSALLKYFPATVAPFIELIHECTRQGLINPYAFTVQDVLDQRLTLGFTLAEGTIRRLFRQAVEVFFSKSNIHNITNMLKIENNSVGRSPTVFCLLPVANVKANILKWAKPRIIESQFPKQDSEQLVTLFDAHMLESIGFDSVEAADIAMSLNTKTGDFRTDHDAQYKHRMKRVAATYRALESSLLILHSTELPPVVVQDAKDYRAVLLRGQVEAGNDNRSGRELAQVLGVRREYVGKVLKHAGISSVDKFEAVTIDKSNVGKLDRIPYDVKGFPRSIAIGNKIIPYDSNEVAMVINEAIMNGYKVEVRYQVASEQVITRDAILMEHSSAAEQPVSVDNPELLAPKPNGKQRKSGTVRRRYGTDFDPAWVKHHLILALHITKTGYIVRRDCLVDTRTGEVIRVMVTTLDLIAVLKGQMLEPEQSVYEHYT